MSWIRKDAAQPVPAFTIVQPTTPLSRRSLARALWIALLVVESPDPPTTSEIIRMTGLPVSTTYRYCTVLADEGFLVREPEPNGTWSPGQRLDILRLAYRRATARTGGKR